MSLTVDGPISEALTVSLEATLHNVRKAAELGERVDICEWLRSDSVRRLVTNWVGSPHITNEDRAEALLAELALRIAKGVPRAVTCDVCGAPIVGNCVCKLIK